MRFVVVGAGLITGMYFRQAEVDPRIEFAAVCARRIESARAAAEANGVSRWFDDYERMYDEIRPDVAIVATPTADHVAPTLAALRRGIHVICEKPLATTYADSVAMIEAARESGVLLRVQSDPGAVQREQRKYLRTGLLGRFTGAEAQILLPSYPAPPWYYERRVAGGGASIDTLIYSVTALIGLLGPARRVTGFGNTLIPHRRVTGLGVLDPDGGVIESDVDDNVTLVLEWEGGQHAALRGFWGSSFSSFQHTVFGRNGTLFCELGRTVVHSPLRPVPGGTPVEYRGLTDCYEVPMPSGVDARYAGVDELIDAVEGVREPTWSPEQQLHVHEILFRGEEAARTGRAQELRTTFVPADPLEPEFFDTRSEPL